MRGTKWAEENFYLNQEYLSNIELYYSSDISDGYIQIAEEESKHLVKVMRHGVGDKLNITDGLGRIFKSEIVETCSTSVTARILNVINYQNQFAEITFCIPRLKSSDRFDFSLEKCVELGITNFVVFNSERSIAKGEKLERWNKIALSAMKQSLRSYIPSICYIQSIKHLNEIEGEKIIFDQNAPISLSEFVKSDRLISEKHSIFIFGPEGGLTEKEISQLENAVLVKLTPNRLRSETAIIATASEIALRI